ncbi:MAG TPA: hypothetical protein VLH79_14560 [Chthonomonadales bacterium]|nr:hypothetical protein [Chthonomonadales bacterium]
MHAPLALLAALVSLQQTPAAEPQRPAATPTAGANVKQGVIASVDPLAGALTVTLRGGASASFRLGDRTQVWENRRRAAATDLRAGAYAVVRHRRSGEPPHMAYDVADRLSWEWLQRIRRDVTTVRVTALEDGWLRAEEGKDRLPVDYRFTEKTTWWKGGATATPSSFKPGDTVSVAPRLLPNGAVMAVSVADDGVWAARLRERSRPSVSGALARYDAGSRTITLRTDLGDERELVLAAACTCRRDGRAVPLTALRPGLRVTAHLRTEPDGVRRCVRLTIQRAAPAGAAKASAGMR